MIISKYSCRLCLKSKSKKSMMKIFNTPKNEEISLIEFIKDTLGIVIKKSKKYPKYICGNCYKRIKDIEKFRLMCVESEKYIKMIHSLSKSRKPNQCANNIIEISDSDSGSVIIEEDVDKTNCSGNAKEPEVVINDVMERSSTTTNGFDISALRFLFVYQSENTADSEKDKALTTDKNIVKDKVSEMQSIEKSHQIIDEIKTEDFSISVSENYEEKLVLVEEENNNPNSSGTCPQYDPPDEIQFVLESEEADNQNTNEPSTSNFNVEVKHEEENFLRTEIENTSENLDPPISALYPKNPPPAEAIKDFICDQPIIIKMELCEEPLDALKICEICKITFQDEFTLQEHNQKHHTSITIQPTNYACSLCSKVFNRLDTLELHRYYCHPNVQETTRKENENKPSEKVPSLLTEIETIICEKCSEEFIYKHDYLDHLRFHSKRKPQKAFQYQDNHYEMKNDIKISKKQKSNES